MKTYDNNPLEQRFNYDNLLSRPAGKFMRIGSKLLPGIKKVQAQVIPYAEAWNKANLVALEQDGPLWIVLGDSMSQGIGASAYDNGWVGQLRAMLDKEGKHYRIINLSMSGARVSDVLEQQIPAMHSLGIKPDLLTVLIGSNDIVSKKYRRSIFENYGELLQRLPANTYVVSPFGDFGIGKKLNRLVEQQAPERHINIVKSDLDGGITSWKGKLAEDHFHPNDTGYKEFALLFFKALTGKSTI